jgi:hypothetical protein
VDKSRAFHSVYKQKEVNDIKMNDKTKEMCSEKRREIELKTKKESKRSSK